MSALVSNHLVLIGTGTFGSIFSFIFLKKYAIKKLTLIDPDKVTTRNLNNQIYSKKHLGKYKVDVLKEILSYHYPSLKIESYPQKFQDVDLKTKNSLVIDAVDNLGVIQYFLINQKEAKEYLFAKIREIKAILLITQDLPHLRFHFIKKQEHEDYRDVLTSWESSIMFSAWITKHYPLLERDSLYHLDLNETLTLDKFLLK